MSKFLNKNLFFNFTVAHILAFIYVCIPSYGVYYGYLLIASGAVFFLLAVRSPTPFLLGFYSLAVLSDGLKFQNYNLYLPSSIMTFLFLLSYQSVVFSEYLKRVASLFTSLRWVSDLKNQSNDRKQSLELPEGVAHFCKNFNVERFSVFLFSYGGPTHVIRYLSGQKKIESDLLSSLPPFVAHCMSTKTSLWHIDPGSSLAVDIRKGELQRYKSKSPFSVIPVFSNGDAIGAVAFTDYDSENHTGNIRDIEFRTVMNSLLPFFETFIKSKMSLQQTESMYHAQKISKSIEEFSLHETNLEILMDRISKLLSFELKSACLIGRFNAENREILIQQMSGHNPKAETLYRGLRFFANKNNEQGPLPLAINKEKIVTIGDTQWISNVVHPTSNEIFSLNQTRSCAAIPIFDHSSEKSSPWGVLWLESPVVGTYTAPIEDALQLIASTIRAAVHTVMISHETETAKKALTGFVPKKALSKLLNGENARIDETGYLFMIDIRGSTKISQHFGAEQWLSFSENMNAELEKIGTKYGFELQMTVWDAFYYTRAGAKSSVDSILLASLYDEVRLYVYEKMIARFPGYIHLEKNNSFRACLVHGDISRDIRTNVTSAWSIVGSSMAVCSKFEQLCKTESGVLFVLGNILSGWSSLKSRVIEKPVPGSLETPYELSLPDTEKHERAA
ncbi:MAG: hypothetical protein KA715_03305 [Xanthomonadaceae bacterium]|nr:hypothetical protein [Xanthomonadaceae bacterium]